mgnify:CR=1 FL=1
MNFVLLRSRLKRTLFPESQLLDFKNRVLFIQAFLLAAS